VAIQMDVKLSAFGLGSVVVPADRDSSQWRRNPVPATGLFPGAGKEGGRGYFSSHLKHRKPTSGRIFPVLSGPPTPASTPFPSHPAFRQLQQTSTNQSGIRKRRREHGNH
jgi:hypothetical protein